MINHPGMITKTKYHNAITLHTKSFQCWFWLFTTDALAISFHYITIFDLIMNHLKCQICSHRVMGFNTSRMVWKGHIPREYTRKDIHGYHWLFASPFTTTRGSSFQKMRKINCKWLELKSLFTLTFLLVSLFACLFIGIWL